MKDEIKHDGIVSDIQGNTVFVSIVSQAACASCSVKGACNAADLQDKTIEVKNADSSRYKTGQHVEVFMGKSLGTKAVMLGYVLPFIVLITSLIVFSGMLKDEGIAGLISLGILVPYYIILHSLRDRLGRTFSFQLRPKA